MKNFLKAILIGIIDMFVWWFVILVIMYTINKVSQSIELIIVGLIVFILTFLFALIILLPSSKQSEEEEELVHKVEKEVLNEVKDKIVEIVDEELNKNE